jgi:hypothetical protein
LWGFFFFSGLKLLRNVSGQAVTFAVTFSGRGKEFKSLPGFVVHHTCLLAFLCAFDLMFSWETI